MPMPAYVRNDRFDILAANGLGEALYSPLYDAGRRRRAPTSPGSCSSARRHRSSSSTGTPSPNDCVAFLRADAGRDPYDKRLSDLIGELSTRSDEFRGRWAAHNVNYHRTGANGSTTRRRRPRPRLRSPRTARRPRPAHQHLHRASRLPIRRRTGPARQLDHARAHHHRRGRGNVEILTTWGEQVTNQEYDQATRA